MLTLTDNARVAIGELLEKSGLPAGAGLRIEPGDGAKGGTELTASIAAEPSSDDAIFEEDADRVFLDSDIIEFLDEKTLDVSEEGETPALRVLRIGALGLGTGARAEAGRPTAAWPACRAVFDREGASGTWMPSFRARRT